MCLKTHTHKHKKYVYLKLKLPLPINELKSIVGGSTGVPDLEYLFVAREKNNCSVFITF